MNIDIAQVSRFRAGVMLFDACEQRDQYFFTQNKESSHRPQAISGGSIAARMTDHLNQIFTSELFQVVRSLPRMILALGDPEVSPYFVCQIRSSESPGFDRKSDEGFHDRPYTRPIDIYSSNLDGSNLRGQVPFLQHSVINKGNIYPVKNGKESLQDFFERFADLRKTIDPFSTAQLLGIVDDNFNSENPFAFAIHLDRHFPKMDFEDRQIIDRSLDRDLESRQMLLAMMAERPALVAKNCSDRLDVQGGSGPVNQAMENLIQGTPPGKEQITAIFYLIDRIMVIKPTCFLLQTIQGKRKTGRINPLIAGPNQTPYRARGPHGICDSGQTCDIGNCRKAVAFFSKNEFVFPSLTSYVFVSIQDNLSSKWWMRAKFDRQVPPFPIHDMERIMIDIGIRGLSANVADHPTFRSLNVKNRGRGNPNNDTKYTPKVRILGNMLLGNLVLTFTALTVNQWDTFLFSIGMNPSAESSCKTHQVSIVQIFIRTLQGTPPCPETTGGLAKWKIGVEHDSIYTIICAIKMFLILFAEFVWYDHRSFPYRSL